MSKLIQMLLENNDQVGRNAAPLPAQQNADGEALLLHLFTSQQMPLQREGDVSQDEKAAIKRTNAIAGVCATKELAKMDLLNPQRYAAIKKAIQAWRPGGDDENRQKCQKIKQTLSALLPVAQQKQRLQQLCLDYKTHLKFEMEAQLDSEYPQVYREYCQNRSVLVMGQGRLQKQIVRAGDADHFVANEAQRLPLKVESPLSKTIEKYRAVSAIQQTLQTSKPAPQQIHDFTQTLAQQKPIIEKHRDSLGTRFLKAVATVLSLGLAAALGIWGVKGQDASKTMDRILQKSGVSFLPCPVDVKTDHFLSIRRA